MVGLGHVFAGGEDFADDAAVDERREVLGLSLGRVTIMWLRYYSDQLDSESESARWDISIRSDYMVARVRSTRPLTACSRLLEMRDIWSDTCFFIYQSCSAISGFVWLNFLAADVLVFGSLGLRYGCSFLG